MDEKDTPQLRPYPQHPPKSLDELSAKLIDNGLSEVSQELLEHRIEQVGYFRLKGYWYPFLTPVLEQSTKRSLPFPTKVLDFRISGIDTLFDQELRMLVFDSIVTIEIYLKSFLAHELSVSGGKFGCMTREGLPGLSYDDHLSCLSSLLSAFTKSNLPYLKHFRSIYSNPLPPYWMIVGCLSYGTLKENFYQGAPDYIKRKLATKLHIFNPNPNPSIRGDAKILSNWLETIRQSRNMTAHHDRFWNETSTRIAPKLPKHRSGSHATDWWGNNWDIFRKSSGPAAFLTMENYLTSQINGPAWTEKFISLMDRYPQIPKSDMGFPDGWRMSPLWQIDGSVH